MWFRPVHNHSYITVPIFIPTPSFSYPQYTLTKAHEIKFSASEYYNQCKHRTRNKCLRKIPFPFPLFWRGWLFFFTPTQGTHNSLILIQCQLQHLTAPRRCKQNLPQLTLTKRFLCGLRGLLLMSCLCPLISPFGFAYFYHPAAGLVGPKITLHFPCLSMYIYLCIRTYHVRCHATLL